MATTAKVNEILSLMDVFGGNKDSFSKYQSGVLDVLPEGNNKNRWWKLYESEAKKWFASPMVSKENKKGILSVMFAAAKYGLCPDPAMGQIYFVPYAGKLTYQIGYKGMINLARQAGCTNVVCDLVRLNDHWEYEVTENGQRFSWKPDLSLTQTERGDVIFAFSSLKYSDGSVSIHIMPYDHITDIGKMVLSRTPKSPWANPLFRPEMEKKTCMRRHFKTEPSSVDIAVMAAKEESIERGEDTQFTDPEIDKILSGVDIPEVQQPEEIDEITAAFGPEQQTGK